MTTIYDAIQSVAQGHEQRVAVPGAWRVYNERGVVWLEVYPADPIVVTTVTDVIDE